MFLFISIRLPKILYSNPALKGEYYLNPSYLDLLYYPDESTTIRTINRDAREDVAEETFKEHYEQQINDIKAKNDIIEREIAKIIHKKMIRNKLYKVLSNIRAYTNKFLDVKDGTELNVYGFKETNTKYGKTYLLACSLNIVPDKNDKLIEYMLEQTILQLYWCPTNITHYIDAVLSNKGFMQLYINGIIAYGSLIGIPIMQLVKTGTFTNVSKNLCAKVIVKGCNNNGTEDIKGSKENIMQEIDANIKQC